MLSLSPWLLASDSRHPTSYFRYPAPSSGPFVLLLRGAKTMGKRNFNIEICLRGLCCSCWPCRWMHSHFVIKCRQKLKSGHSYAPLADGVTLRCPWENLIFQMNEFLSPSSEGAMAFQIITLGSRGEALFCLSFSFPSRRQQLQVMLKGQDLGTSETN